MNFVNSLLNFFNDRKELMKIQESNDIQMEKLDCKNVLTAFLFHERNNTRCQIIEGSNLSIFDMSSYMNKANELNKKNLLIVKDILESNNPCEKLNEIVNIKATDYSVCFKNQD